MSEALAARSHELHLSRRRPEYQLCGVADRVAAAMRKRAARGRASSLVRARSEARLRLHGASGCCEPRAAVARVYVKLRFQVMSCRSAWTYHAYACRHLDNRGHVLVYRARCKGSASNCWLSQCGLRDRCGAIEPLRHGGAQDGLSRSCVSRSGCAHAVWDENKTRVVACEVASN